MAAKKASEKGIEKSAKPPARKTARAARPTTEWEIRCGHPGVVVAGVDEVGRGCLAGPVTAGAVILPPVIDLERDPWLREVTDSKCLSPEKREELAPLIARWALASAVASATVEEIDRLNIYHASHLAMCRAIEKLDRQPSHILIDGNRVPAGLPCPGTAVVKGDLKCLSVAAASILAKVWRDRAMAELDARYPGYGFAIHKGYSTPAHSAALRAQGPCEIHRRSFAPVALQLQGSLGF